MRGSISVDAIRWGRRRQRLGAKEDTASNESCIVSATFANRWGSTFVADVTAVSEAEVAGSGEAAVGAAMSGDLFTRRTRSTASDFRVIAETIAAISVGLFCADGPLQVVQRGRADLL